MSVKVAEYKFNSSIDTLFSEVNDGFVYTHTDIDNGDGTITRTIYSDQLPTKIRFEDCEGLLELLYLNTSELTSLRKTFRNCYNVTSINATDWDTSNVTSLYEAFEECNSLISLDVSNFNTSNVTNMFCMFSSCNKLTSLDVSNFNTSKVTNMAYMFNNCQSLTTLDVSNWDTSEVTDMDYAFYNCNSLTELNVGDWDVSKVHSFEGLFNSCKLITSFDLRKWQTDRVTSMRAMFANCNSLISINLSGINTSNVTDMTGTFGCVDGTVSQLISIDLSGFDLNNLTNMNLMLYACNKLDTIEMSASDYNSVNKIIAQLPTRTSNKQGKIYIGNIDLSSVNKSDAEAKYWKIITEITVNKNMMNVFVNDNNIKGFKVGNSKTYGLKNIWFSINPLNYKTNLAFITPKVVKFFFNGFINPTGGFSNLENEYGAICINLSKYIGNNIRIKFNLSVNNGGAGIYLRETDVQETDYTKTLFDIVEGSGEYNIDETIYVTNSTKYMWIEGYNVEYNDLEIYGMGSSKVIPAKYNIFNELALIQPENYDSIITDSGFKIDYNDYTKVGIDLSKYINKAVRIKANVTIAGSEACIYLRPSNNCDGTATQWLYGKYDCVDTVQENIDLSFVVSDFNKFIWFEGFYVEYSNVEIYVEGIKNSNIINPIFIQGGYNDDGTVIDEEDPVNLLGATTRFIDISNFSKVNIVSDNVNETLIGIAAVLTFNSNKEFIEYINLEEACTEYYSYTKTSDVKYIKVTAFKVTYNQLTADECQFTITFE